MDQKPLCFVIMPFGKRLGKSCININFDAIYNNLIVPAIKDSGLKPLRAEEEKAGGIIHKPMFERLILCEYALVDLTTANANIFYELGVRHAVRPKSTILMFAKGEWQIPFDISSLRAIPYCLTPDGTPADIEITKTALINRLQEARQPSTDSPIYQLIEGFPQIDHTKTDIFRDRIDYCAIMKNRLCGARKIGINALREIDKELKDIKDTEAGIVIDLFLSYRSVNAWQDMIELARKMSPPLAATVMVQEQLALALNRLRRGDEAEKILLNLIEKRGPSSETYGILGRIYKDKWESSLEAGDELLAKGFLEKAISSYLKGFETDWRDAYPGINALTLMEINEPADSWRQHLIPVVNYAVERRIASGTPDYWDYATCLELAVLAKDKTKAQIALSSALASIREKWEPETTARNLRIIREARERRNEEVPWVKEIEEELKRFADK